MKIYLNQQMNIDRMIDVLDELPLWSAAFGLKLLDYIDYKPNIKALDLGFGTGFPLTELAMRLGTSCTVYGIDPWKAAIERTRKKIALYGITNIHLIEGVAESIPMEDSSIDLVTSNNGINNTADMGRSVAECARILKKGGQFIQTMNLDKSMFEFYGKLEKVLLDFNLTREIESMYQHIDQKRPSLDKMIGLLEKNDFLVTALEHDQFNYRFTDGTTMLNHYFIRLAFMDSWIDLLPPDRTEEIFNRVESGLNKDAKISGGLKLSIPFVLINARKR